MISAETRKKYTPTIGIECHVQLKTVTKLFSAVSNDARSAAPNTLISHIDLGMPGALPVLNEKAVEYAIKVAFAFNVEPQKYSFFERKHYFYPDLPKGYQITQLSHPIVVGGTVIISVSGEEKEVRINRVQMEEDAGKSTHPAGKEYSLVDLNRAGTPLLEIVSEPDMHSAEEAKAYAEELYLLIRYTDVSDADMYHGNMRFDVNVSLSKESGKLGTRTETKNLNSFRSVEKAVEYEIDRQIELLEKGEKITQETRGWDDTKQKTFSQRSKEEAHDYRYMPEPDVPPIELDDKMVESIKQTMPVLPHEWRQRLHQLGLETAQVETLLLAEVDDVRVNYLPLIEHNLENREFAKTLANWFVNIEIPLRRSEQKLELEQTDDTKRMAQHSGVYELVKAGKLSSNGARSLLIELLTTAVVPDNLEKYAEEQGYIQDSDEGAISKVVEEVLAENTQAAEDVKNGEMKAIGFLVGQVMKKSQGKANPSLAQELIKKQLGL
jgi:aspartyl-tRNA(Asn)/glutamyl-tRNA(Gln) amidotransferase subunit B